MSGEKLWIGWYQDGQGSDKVYAVSLWDMGNGREQVAAFWGKRGSVYRLTEKVTTDSSFDATNAYEDLRRWQIRKGYSTIYENSNFAGEGDTAIGRSIISDILNQKERHQRGNRGKPLAVLFEEEKAKEMMAKKEKMTVELEEMRDKGSKFQKSFEETLANLGGLPIKTSEFEVECVDNRGLEGELEVGRVYRAEVHKESDMVWLVGEGKREEYFLSRFKKV